ncbi:MAG: hypothetical protein GPOALKHO_000757 [Sodalis sp.]|nr:MAG: hypothetical protein GPOALKHO_000757 [Sodalis sp.]
MLTQITCRFLRALLVVLYHLQLVLQPLIQQDTEPWNKPVEQLQLLTCLIVLLLISLMVVAKFTLQLAAPDVERAYVRFRLECHHQVSADKAAERLMLTLNFCTLNESVA